MATAAKLKVFLLTVQHHRRSRVSCRVISFFKLRTGIYIWKVVQTRSSIPVAGHVARYGLGRQVDQQR